MTHQRIRIRSGGITAHHLTASLKSRSVIITVMDEPDRRAEACRLIATEFMGVWEPSSQPPDEGAMQPILDEFTNKMNSFPHEWAKAEQRLVRERQNYRIHAFAGAIYLVHQSASETAVVGLYAGDTLFLAKEHRRKGLGSELVLALFAQHGPSEWMNRRHQLTDDAVRAFGGAHKLGLHSARTSLLKSLMKTVASTNATTYLSLQPDVPTHPIPYFGDPGSAVIATIGVNPSDGEFRGRGWPSTLDAAALDHRLTAYFKGQTPPHPWFRGWERALKLLDHSYYRDAVHLDLSPRATVRMTDADPQLFRQMVEHDMRWFFSCFEMSPHMKCLMMAGGVTNIYISEFFRRHLPSGYSVATGPTLPLSGGGAGAAKLFTLHAPKRTFPVFFYGVSPSKDQGRGDRLVAEVKEHLETLKTVGF
jgi:GNAT superfamily N-acetyltransferase